jgi:putative drug exporter of the RND superfamily
MLKNLAKMVMRRPKTVVAIWLVALVIALPLAGMVGGALEYDDAKMGTNSLESVQGTEYATINFPSLEHQGTTSIVLKGPNILSNETKRMISSMESNLTEELGNEGLDVRFDSVYSIMTEYSTEYLVQLRSAFEAVNATMTGQGDPTTVMGISEAIIAQKANVSSWLVQMTAEPESFGVDQATAMAEGLVSNYSLSAFPISIPTELLGARVNLPLADIMIISMSYLNGDAMSGRENIPLVRGIVHSSIPDSSSMNLYVTGSDAYYSDNTSGIEKDMAIIEPLTIILIIVLIGVVFRSFVASSTPPVVIGLALMISLAFMYLIGTYVFSVHYSVLMLMLTSMMGAGCDYCIFILSRYREERHGGKGKREAISASIEFAGESILTSGLTVMIGFGTLALASLDMLRSWSILALGVGIALLISLTMLPALLMLLGDRMFWPDKMNGPMKKSRDHGYFTRTAHFAIDRAKIIVLATVIISIPATYLVINLDSSYDMVRAMPESESKQGLLSLTDAFGEGSILPTYVVLNMTNTMSTDGVLNQVNMNVIENVSSSIASLGNIKQVISPSRPNGESGPVDYANLSHYSAEIAAQYSSKIQSMIGEDGRAVIISVTFIDSPYSERSIGSIKEIRSTLAAFDDSPEITAVYVAGNSALMYDIVNVTQADFLVIEVLAIILIYVVLMIVLGSVVNPLRSILTIMISIGWTLGAMVVVFQWILNIPILWTIPIILLVVCLGLGMDYDILLTTRIREEAAKGRSDHEAIIHSIEQTGGIITACGIIMASAFATMMLSSNTSLMELGFALSFAILLDATVVRMYMVPAIMSLLGKWNWYAPGRLQRVNRKGVAPLVSPSIVAQELIVEGVDEGKDQGR